MIKVRYWNIPNSVAYDKHYNPFPGLHLTDFLPSNYNVYYILK